MKKISIDFETTSPVDLPRCGVHAYARDPRTEVLCCAYSVDGGPIRVWKRGEEMPREFADKDAEFHAWNAQFERNIWKDVLHWPEVKWRCTMASAAQKGLPLHLKDAAAALKTSEQKDEEGASLMKVVSKIPADQVSPEQMDRLAKYCAQDVRTEMEISSRVGSLPPDEQSVWEMDQRMNDYGLGVDRDLVTFLMDLTDRERALMESRLYELTDGDITSINQHIGIRKWLADRGLALPSLRAADVRGVDVQDPKLKEVLSIRLEGAKSSLAKLESMKNYNSGRLRGLFQYHGAATGRWAGRGVQLQNFPRAVPVPPVEEIMWLPVELAAAELRGKGGVMSWASSALRSCIIPAPGASLYVADYSQIETRILAWLAGDPTLLKAFSEGADPYVQFASSMYKVRPDEVTKAQRQIAKSAVLGLGYSMGPARYCEYAATYGADISVSEAERIVDFYRSSHRHVVELWRGLEGAAMRAVEAGTTQESHRTYFYTRGQNLICRLPSGRELTYWYVHLDKSESWPELTYSRKDQVSGKWVRRRMYGGSITENVVQALARDVLVHGMKCVEQAGFKLVGTVHDEVLAEAAPGKYDEFVRAFSEMPRWLGIKIPAEGKEAKRWSK